MEHIEEIFAESDCWCEINNAVAFSMTEIFLYLDIASHEADMRASLLIRVDLSDQNAHYNIIQSLDFGALDYFARSPDDHWLLVSGGYLHHIEGGTETFFEPMTDLFLRGMEPLDHQAILLFGEDGAIFRFENGSATRIENSLDEELLAAHVYATNASYICGTNGALLNVTGSNVTPIDLGGNDEFEAVHALPNGSVLLGVNDGSGIILRNSEIIRVGQADGGIQDITTFKGVEYWGDDDFGVYVRTGPTLVKKFETEGGFELNSTSEVMSVVNGAEVYLFDGDNWIQLHITPSVETLVTRVPLDFTPL